MTSIIGKSGLMEETVIIILWIRHGLAVGEFPVGEFYKNHEHIMLSRRRNVTDAHDSLRSGSRVHRFRSHPVARQSHICGKPCLHGLTVNVFEHSDNFGRT